MSNRKKLQHNRHATESQVDKYLRDPDLLSWVVDRWSISNSSRQSVAFLLEKLFADFLSTGYEEDVFVCFDGYKTFTVGIDAASFRVWITNPFWFEKTTGTVVAKKEMFFDWGKTAFDF